MPDVTKKWLRVIGIGEDGWDDLSRESLDLLYESNVVLGGERHLNMLPDDWQGERIVWPSPIKEAVSQIVSWRPQHNASSFAENCRLPVAIMASGDPLCYGIAAKLLRHIPIEEMWIKPALTTFSLMCSRVGWSLPDVETLTIHGRPVEMLHPFVQPGAKLLVLNKDSNSPKEAANLLTQRGFGKSKITVLEHLGGKPANGIPKEKQFSGHANSWNHPAGAELNAMAIESIPDPNAKMRARVPGLPDDAFLHDGQLTKREVRAVTLSRLMPVVDQVLWDVGAGCGSVAIEWVRHNSRCQAFAIENNETRLKLIEQNAKELGTPTLNIVNGTIPDALKDLPKPDAIFIGGGLTSPNLMETCWQALKPGGRLVANCVTIEGEQILQKWKMENGGELMRLAVSRVEKIGQFQGWKDQRPVVQYSIIKDF